MVTSEAATSSRKPPRPSEPDCPYTTAPAAPKPTACAAASAWKRPRSLPSRIVRRETGCENSELGGAAIGGEGQDADQQRGERHEQQHELHERDGGAREVLDPVAAGEHVARPRHREGEDAEDDGEDLRPARAEREDQLLLREEAEVRAAHLAAPTGSPTGPNSSATETDVPARASASWSREAASACAITCEPIGVSRPGTRV